MKLPIDIPRTPVPKWRRGMLVKADHLNKMRDPLNQLLGGVQPSQQVRRIRPALTQQFKIIANGIHDNHLKCHTWAGEDATEGTEIIEVARPWRLRANPVEYWRHGIKYTYVSSLERIASRTLPGEEVQTETQVIVPPWRVGDIIVAATNIAGGLDGAWGPNLPFAWLVVSEEPAWCEKNAAHK